MVDFSPGDLVEFDNVTKGFEESVEKYAGPSPWRVEEVNQHAWPWVEISIKGYPWGLSSDYLKHLKQSTNEKNQQLLSDRRRKR